MANKKIIYVFQELRKALIFLTLASMIFMVCSPNLLNAQEDNATTTEPLIIETIGQSNAAESSPTTTTAIIETGSQDNQSGDSAATTTEPVIQDETGQHNSTAQTVAALQNTAANAGENENASTTSGAAANQNESPAADLGNTLSGGEIATTTSEIADDAEEINEKPVLPSIILALWQMVGQGEDESPDNYFQVKPSGQYQASKAFKVCGAISNIAPEDSPAIASNIYYPKELQYPLAADSGDLRGCGKSAAPGCSMESISKNSGYELFCSKIRNANPNLPVFGIKSGAGTPQELRFDYGDICDAENAGLRGDVLIFCCDRTLAYDDPAGDYAVDIAVANENTPIAPLESRLTYLPVTAFEIDFGNVDYGTVSQNSQSCSIGDNIWENAPGGKMSFRNVGNTRLDINVWQDDMGLGKNQAGDYNATYKARLGKDENSWLGYFPYQTLTIKETLEVSQTSNLDFCVNVLDFPSDESNNYTGKLELGASMAPYGVCEIQENQDSLSMQVKSK